MIPTPTVDWLALAFAAVVCLYAVIPQDVLDGEAGARAVLYGLRHGLVPVVAYFLGRSLILDRAEQMLVRCRRAHEPVAALFIDLDNFKEVNDTLGHEAAVWSVGNRTFVLIAREPKVDFERMALFVRTGLH